MTERPVDVPALRIAYRRLVLWFGAQLLLNANAGPVVLRAAPRPSLAISLLTGILGLATLATIVALAYYGFRTATALGSPAPWLWALAMFVPCLNVMSLLALSSKATQACAARGIPVGLLGPR